MDKEITEDYIENVCEELKEALNYLLETGVDSHYDRVIHLSNHVGRMADELINN